MSLTVVRIVRIPNWEAYFRSELGGVLRIAIFSKSELVYKDTIIE